MEWVQPGLGRWAVPTRCTGKFMHHCPMQLPGSPNPRKRSEWLPANRAASAHRTVLDSCSRKGCQYSLAARARASST